MRLVAISLVLIGLWCCKAKEKPFPNIQTNGKITIVDSTETTENLYAFSKERLEDPYYPIYYLGPLQDTFYLGKEPLPSHGAEDPDFGKVWVTFIDSQSMKIFVDTTMYLAHEIKFKHNDYENEKTIIDSIANFKAYPVFVYNLTDSILYMGFFNFLRNTNRQAKNEKGKWVDIEFLVGEYCATGASEIYFGPKQMAVAKLLRFKGDLLAECRLKYQRGNNVVYSNTFFDYIDARHLQFRKPKSSY